MSYRIWIYEESENKKENVQISFGINEKWLLNQGVNESSLTELEEYIKQVSGQDDMKYDFFEKNVEKCISKFCAFDQSTILQHLKKLIEKTKTKIDSIFEQ